MTDGVVDSRSFNLRARRRQREGAGTARGEDAERIYGKSPGTESSKSLPLCCARRRGRGARDEEEQEEEEDNDDEGAGRGRRWRGGGGGRVSPLDLSRELGVEYAKYVNGQGERARKDSTTRAKSRDGKCGAAAPVCAKTRRWEGGGVGGGNKRGKRSEVNEIRIVSKGGTDSVGAGGKGRGGDGELAYFRIALITATAREADTQRR